MSNQKRHMLLLSYHLLQKPLHHHSRMLISKHLIPRFLLLIGRKMLPHCLFYLCHLATFQAFARQNQILFHLFNIAPNVLLIILLSLVAVIPILIPILFIHPVVVHLIHHIFTPKHILTLTGNLTPVSWTSAAVSRLWDGSVLIDTFPFFVFMKFYLIFLTFVLFSLFALCSDTPVF